MTSIDITGKTLAELLQEARRLLDRHPRPGEAISDIEGRRVAAAWLVAEVDYRRVAGALKAQARADAEVQQRPLDPEDFDPEAVKRAAKATALRMGPVREFKAPPPTSTEPEVIDACPSRMITPEDRKIVHCDTINHETWPDGTLRHHAPGWQWTDGGAMPDDQPCDSRCAQCVERARNAVLGAAVAWQLDIEESGRVGNAALDHALSDAVHDYRKVMGL